VRESSIDSRGIQQECIGNDLLAGLEAGENFLPISIEHFSAWTSVRLNWLPPAGQINPIAIVEVENRIGRDNGVGFLGAASKGSGAEHAKLEEAGVGDFDAHFGSAEFEDQAPGRCR